MAEKRRKRVGRSDSRNNGRGLESDCVPPLHAREGTAKKQRRKVFKRKASQDKTGLKNIRGKEKGDLKGGGWAETGQGPLLQRRNLRGIHHS